MDTPAQAFAKRHIANYFSQIPADQKTALESHFEAAYLEGLRDGIRTCTTAVIDQMKGAPANA